MSKKQKLRDKVNTLTKEYTGEDPVKFLKKIKENIKTLNKEETVQSLMELIL